MSNLPGDGHSRQDIRVDAHDARLYSAAEKHRQIKEARLGDREYDAPDDDGASLLMRLRRRLGIGSKQG